MRSRDQRSHRIRICLVAHDSGQQGAERALLDMAVLLQGAGWGVTAVVPATGPLQEALIDAGICVFVIRHRYWIGSGRLLGIVRRFLENFVAIVRFLSFFNRSSFDVIYTHSVAVVVPAICARIAGIPHVWHLHEYLPMDAASSKIERQKLGQRFDLGVSPSVRLMKWSNSTYIAVSEAVASAVTDHLEHAQLEVVYQPVRSNFELDERDSQVARMLQSAPGPNLVCVGAVTPFKRQEDAIAALPAIIASYPWAHLYLIGRIDQDYRTYLETVTAEFHVSNAVTYLGECAGAPALMGFADLSIHCGWYETYNRALYESMSVGTLVVAARSGANPEGVGESRGLLFKRGDPADLARQILWALENPAEADRLTLAAQAFTTAHREIASYGPEYVRQIERIVTRAIA